MEQGTNQITYVMQTADTSKEHQKILYTFFFNKNVQTRTG